MEIVISLLLFVPLIIKCFMHKKWYMCMFFAFYGILPDTFAIEISSSLPLITGKRVLILVLLIIWCAKKQGRVGIGHAEVVCIYILLELLISVVNFRFGLDEINRCFLLVFERFIPIIVINDLINYNEEIEIYLDFVLYGSIVVAIVGLLQTATNLDLSIVFQIVEERSSTVLTDRMGIMRAKGLFNAIQYGCYCNFVVIIALYKFIISKRRFYLFVTGINLVALMCSMSRSSIVPMILLGIYILIRNKKKLMHIIFKIIPVAIVMMIIIWIARPNIFDVAINLWNSMLRTLGISAQVSSSFGDNVDASISRLMQFSLIPYMFMNGGGVFGLGYHALSKGLLHFYFPMYNGWGIATFIDVGIVYEFAVSGLVGVSITIWFMYSIYKQAKIRSTGKKLTSFYQLMQYELVMYVLLNILSSCMASNIFWMLIMLFFAKKKVDLQGDLIHV